MTTDSTRSKSLVATSTSEQYFLGDLGAPRGRLDPTLVRDLRRSENLRALATGQKRSYRDLADAAAPFTNHLVRERGALSLESQWRNLRGLVQSPSGAKLRNYATRMDGCSMARANINASPSPSTRHTRAPTISRGPAGGTISRRTGVPAFSRALVLTFAPCVLMSTACDKYRLVPVSTTTGHTTLVRTYCRRSCCC